MIKRVRVCNCPSGKCVCVCGGGGGGGRGECVLEKGGHTRTIDIPTIFMMNVTHCKHIYLFKH